MLILHLSDLHFGTHSRFKAEDLAKLGKAFFKDLNAARGSFAKGSRIDLVAVTGDIAESGKPTEFRDGERFLAALSGELGLGSRPGGGFALCQTAQAVAGNLEGCLVRSAPSTLLGRSESGSSRKSGEKHRRLQGHPW